MKFYDMDGKEIKVGDYVEPVEGERLYIFSKGMHREYGEEVMFGQQTENLTFFSALTAENLALQFKKVGEKKPDTTESDEIINILIGSIS